MRLMHTGDVHLGYRQYSSDDRQRDFARAFDQMCRRAIAEHCGLVLIAGDLFHGTAMDARTFLQAVGALRPLWEEGIDVVAIAGNHDRARTNHGLSWLHALQALGYLRLLEIGIEDGELTLEHAAYETDEVRVLGVPFIGRALRQLIPQIAKRLATLPRKFTFAMFHAGLEGEIPGFRAGLSMEALEPLRSLVDYVALSHIHKPFTRDNWVWNPGSLETVSIDEAQWEGRGAIIITVEDGKAIDFEWAIPRRRPFVQLEFGVDTFRDPEALYRFHALTSKDHAQLRAQEIGQNPVVELRLQGCLQFDRSALELSRIEQIIEDAYHPLLIRIRDLTETEASEITIPADATRAEIERQVVRELVARDVGRKEHANDWTTLILEIKDMALARSDPERITDQTRSFHHGLQGAINVRNSQMKEEIC